MAVRAQMDQTKQRKLNFVLKSTKNATITYMLIQLHMKQLPLVVAQYLFHASTTSDHAQLCPKDAIILQFLRCLGNVTWNICL